MSFLGNDEESSYNRTHNVGIRIIKQKAKEKLKEKRQKLKRTHSVCVALNYVRQDETEETLARYSTNLI